MNIFKIFFVFFLTLVVGGCNLVYVKNPNRQPPENTTSSGYSTSNFSNRTLLYVGLEKSTNYSNCSVRVVDVNENWRTPHGREDLLNRRLNGLEVKKRRFRSEQAQILIEPGRYKIVILIKNHRNGRQKKVRKSIWIPNSTRDIYRTLGVYTGSFCNSISYDYDYDYDNCYRRNDCYHYRDSDNRKKPKYKKEKKKKYKNTKKKKHNKKSKKNKNNKSKKKSKKNKLSVEDWKVLQQ